jgi:hypothetical protein
MRVAVKMHNNTRKRGIAHKEATICRLSVDTPLLLETIVYVYSVCSALC